MPAIKTFLTGLLGEGITASRSAEIHQDEAKALGRSLVYRLIDFKLLRLNAADLGSVLAAAENFGFDGLNVTHPYKQAVIPFLDTLSPEATAIGSVNTVVFRDGRRIGYNTDWYGFTESFRAGLPDVPVQQVVQLGAGGAGSAVAYALMHLGVSNLFVFDTDYQKATALAVRLQPYFVHNKITAITDLAEMIPLANGIVHTTPVGMSSYPGMPFDESLLKPSQWLAEIIYFPPETRLLAYARSIGCRAISGIGMVVHQAVKAFELFTGIKPDVDRMFRNLSEAN